MVFKAVLSALPIISPVFASPEYTREVPGEHGFRGLIERDDGCVDQTYATTLVDYYGCSTKFTMDKDGHCAAGIPEFAKANPGGCQGYCEVKVNYFFGQEIPYPNIAYRADAECSLQRTSARATEGRSDKYNETDLVTRDDDPSIPLKATFNLGSSHTWTDSYQHTVGSVQTKPQDEKRCGRFSFVPNMVMWDSDSLSVETCAASPDLLEVHATTAADDVMNPDNTPMGLDVFVVTDCGTGAPTPDGQDKIYYQPGVSLDKEWKGDPSGARPE
ncbi:hypothetical protein NUW58_g5014 [Xylaria curta]|uniref:Uncharacterized protein n=1 Tax=Xylaria curta TaxID=42375 RepID=A0ACC1P6A0_9PEZI|nr:hypothetical protein NUW58_g5014 [Xylaria curta]